MFVKINGERHYLWRAVDHEGEVLESFVTKARDKKAALKFLKKAMRKHGRPEVIVTDRLRSYGAALREIGAADRQETGPLGEQSRRKLTPPVPTTRTCDATIQADAKFTEIRLCACLSPQPLQSGTQPLKQTNL